MQFEEIPAWFGKPLTSAEIDFLRKSAERMNRGLVNADRQQPAPVERQ